MHMISIMILPNLGRSFLFKLYKTILPTYLITFAIKLSQDLTQHICVKYM